MKYKKEKMLLVTVVLVTLITGGVQQIILGRHGPWAMPPFSLPSLLVGLAWFGITMFLGLDKPIILLNSMFFFSFFTAWRPIDLPVGSFTAPQIFSIGAILAIILQYRHHSLGTRRIPVVILILLGIMTLSAPLTWFIDTDAVYGLLREGRSNPVIRSITTIGAVMIGMSAYFVTVCLLKTPARIMTAIKCWIWGALFTTLVGGYCFVLHYVPALPSLPLPTLGIDGSGILARGQMIKDSWGGGSDELFTRVASFASEPRHFALVLAPLVCFLLVMVLFSPSMIGYKRKYLLMITAIIMVGFSLTASRTTYFLFIAILGILLWVSLISRVHNYAKLLLVLVSTIITFLGIYTIIYSHDPINSISLQLLSVQETEITGTGMIEALYGAEVAWNMFLDNPFLGQGVGSYIYFLGGGDLAAIAPTTNNLYLTMISETGIIGLIIILWLFIIGLRTAWAPLQSAPGGQLPLLIALGAALLTTYCGFIFWDTISYPNLWMLLGLVQAARDLAIKENISGPVAAGGVP